MAYRVFSSLKKRLPALISSSLARYPLGPCNYSRNLIPPPSHYYGNLAAASSQGIYHEDMYDHLLQVYREDDSVSVARFMEVRGLVALSAFHQRVL